MREQVSLWFWSVVFPGLLTFAAVALGIVATFIINWLRSKTKVSKAEQEAVLGQLIDVAFQRGKVFADLGAVDPKDRAAWIAEYVLKQIPDKLAELRVTNDQVARRATVEAASPSAGEPAPKYAGASDASLRPEQTIVRHFP